jgi:hypothetical protein
MADRVTSEVTKEMAARITAAQEKKKALKEVYAKEKQVPVNGSPFYRPYFGNNMPIWLNGFAIYVPLDGKTYKIPQSFANIFFERIKRVDATIQRMGVLGANIEDEMIAGDFELDWL